MCWCVVFCFVFCFKTNVVHVQNLEAGFLYDHFDVVGFFVFVFSSTNTPGNCTVYGRIFVKS